MNGYDSVAQEGVGEEEARETKVRSLEMRVKDMHLRRRTAEVADAWHTPYSKNNSLVRLEAIEDGATETMLLLSTWTELFKKTTNILKLRCPKNHLVMRS